MEFFLKYSRGRHTAPLIYIYIMLTTMLCSTFTGVLCQLPSTKDTCPGDDVTFICNTTLNAVIWLVTPAVGNVSVCTVIRDTIPTDTCGPMDVFTAVVSGDGMTSTLSAQSVTDALNGTRVECEVGDVDEEICIVGQRIITWNRVLLGHIRDSYWTIHTQQLLSVMFLYINHSMYLTAIFVGRAYSIKFWNGYTM